MSSVGNGLPDGGEGAAGMGEEDDEESTGVRRRWFGRGVGNLGEVAGDCGAVDKLGMGAEVVDCGGELLRRAGEIDPNAEVLGKTTHHIIQIKRHMHCQCQGHGCRWRPE
ncbi:hypothetical protein [Neochlamydia sp. TUME1]|uniref:hypothetical protein n=1 Tax=Neochlamydia sp. TUME1 TaxID=1478174 RepID=UPI00057E24AA|nr:hypothetical protein [Neochlamydia sp. TUME1]